jgi:hypothetical protein
VTSQNDPVHALRRLLARSEERVEVHGYGDSVRFHNGGVLSLGSGNYYVTLAVGLLGLLIGVILGIVHRNDPSV